MVKRITPRKTDNYAFLLSGLLVLFLLLPLLRSFPDLAGNAMLKRIGMQTGFTTLMLLGVWSMHRETYLFRVGLALAVANVALTFVNIFYDSIAIEAGLYVIVLLFSITSTVIAGKHVFSAVAIDRNLLYGATCIYLLMGLIWALLYRMISQFSPGSFNGLQSPDLDNFLYFSFVTLASLGYGDITPHAPLARTLAYLEVITGQMYIAIMVAGVVGLYLISGRKTD
ncbi:MAG: potassium channel family protein [Gammaproteobacteria bacterium]